MLGSTNTWKNNLSEHVPTLSMRMLMQPAGGRAMAWPVPRRGVDDAHHDGDRVVYRPPRRL